MTWQSAWHTPPDGLENSAWIAWVPVWLGGANTNCLETRFSIVKSSDGGPNDVDHWTVMSVPVGLVSSSTKAVTNAGENCETLCEAGDRDAEQSIMAGGFFFVRQTTGRGKK